MEFSKYMQEWLYGKDGYYRHSKIGVSGDFYTSASVSDIFGYSIANYISKLITKNTAIVEIGANTGDLIASVAYFINNHNIEAKYITIEPLKELVKIQQNTFNQRIKDKELITTDNFESLKSYDNIIFISNELFDAFPCEIYDSEDMAFIEHGNLIFKKANNKIKQIAKKFNIQRGEIPILDDFFKNLESLQKWYFISFDYGLVERKDEFTLRFYKNHKTRNLFLSPNKRKYKRDFIHDFGQCDITYEVNFEILKDYFLSLNAKEVLFGRQNRILVDMGLDMACNWYIEHFGFESYSKESSKIRTLIDPSFLGERFFGFCYCKE